MRMKEAAEFKALLQELIYISPHPLNEWKKREVGILLISSFVEDISMYMTRNPDYEMLQKIFDELHVTKFNQAP